ncbi:MAG: sensor histidine kinase [Deltaproteobacteria bacterium]|jgi:signal transduction histidine kinase|nr:sensor histidine kinase [Deltaproteobacteria bacterium]
MSDLHPTSPTADNRAEPDEKASHLAFVAHEIRNPLSTALWSVELLARMTPEERGGARGEKLSRMSMRALTKLRRLVEDHLLAARLDVGGIPIELEEIPAREIFPGAGVIGAGSLELELETGLVVVADPILARRAVEGVLLAAARGGADVRVTGTRRGRVARFRAEGAPPSVAELEDPRRGDPGDTRGSALALPVARRVCALLGGSIRIEGEAWVLELPAPEGSKRHS